MEYYIKIAIYIHAFLGGIGLITGIASALATKGSKLHKRLGKLFSIGMIGSSLISIPVSTLPNHENLFLFLIGLFTIYLVLAGNSALKFKKKIKADWSDLTISTVMMIFSVIMIVVGFHDATKGNNFSILYLFFGGFGMLLTINDFKFYKNPRKTKNAWLIAHLGKMNGALIASITAFLIAGVGSESFIAWLAPTLIGTLYILYWKRKMKIKPVLKKEVY